MDAAIAARIADALRAFGTSEIRLGWSGIALATDVVRETDVNRSCAKDPRYIVIGAENTCGDPLVVDSSRQRIAVFCVNHDSVDDPAFSGEHEPVADSLEQFLHTLARLREHLAARNADVSYEASPMSPAEVEDFVAEHCARNPLSGDGHFWRLLLERDAASTHRDPVNGE